MLTPTTVPIANFADSFEPKTAYRLRDVQLIIPDPTTAVFSARVEGPPGATALVRAWVSNAAEGTLAEAELAEVEVGREVTLTTTLPSECTPELACVRIESEPFATKHTMHVELG